VHPLIANNLEGLRSIGRDFGVVRLEVFGSINTPEYGVETSDIDFLVEFPEGYDFGPWHARYHAMQRALSALLDHPVDLIDIWALRDPWFSREAGITRQVVYDAAHLVQTAS
jgi:predicted nucleotidyltransferase